jgi:superfamily II DNA or RNA helicase
MAENQINSFTVEQLRCLDQLEDNSRILVNGRAGTGKTLIAIEETKRSVVQGEKVALLCYNSKLSIWMKSYFENIPEALRPCYVGTLHSFMTGLLGNKKFENYDLYDHNFYKQDLPIMVMEKIDECGVYFDKIIVDEAQDLLIPEYLDVMDYLLKNGIDRGRWSFYGDFEMQNIFNSYGVKNDQFH